jgi:hypothetical protein
MDAIYERGKLTLPQPLSLPEKAHVRVTIETDDAERENCSSFPRPRCRGPGTMRRMMSSMNCSRNDVVLLPVPFTDLTSRHVCCFRWWEWFSKLLTPLEPALNFAP